MTEEKVRDIRVDGQQLHVAVRAGQAGRPPLLIINGIGASLELLQPFVAALDPAQGVIRFDVPGVGGSPMPARPYRFTGLCKLIARMLSVLGHSAADVLGISWGGGVAQHFASHQQPRCRRLVLVSTATGATMLPPRPAVLMQMLTRQRYVDNGHLARVAPDLYGGSARAEPARVSETIQDNNRIGPSLGYYYQLTAALGWTSMPFLRRLQQPTLIISGDDDPLIPVANAQMMHRLIPQSRLHIFRGGHLGLVAEAAELAPVVCAFLAAPRFAAELWLTGEPRGELDPGSRAGTAETVEDERGDRRMVAQGRADPAGACQPEPVMEVAGSKQVGRYRDGTAGAGVQRGHRRLDRRLPGGCERRQHRDAELVGQQFRLPAHIHRGLLVGRPGGGQYDGRPGRRP